jgi:L-fuculose-phosphate aldolase
MANHGQITVGKSGSEALELADEVELLAEQYWKVLAIGKAKILDDDEMERVVERFAGYGQKAQG